MHKISILNSFETINQITWKTSADLGSLTIMEKVSFHSRISSYTFGFVLYLFPQYISFANIFFPCKLESSIKSEAETIVIFRTPKSSTHVYKPKNNKMSFDLLLNIQA
eukprot:UN27227